jgi:hypothetical protein
LQHTRAQLFAQLEQQVTGDVACYFLWAPRHFMGFSATLGGVAAVGVHLDGDRNNHVLLDWFLTG